MRFVIIMVFCFSYTASGQLSLSLNATKRPEGSIYHRKKGSLAYFSPSLDRRYLNDYYGVSLDYERNNWMISGDLTYLYKAYNLIEVERKGNYDVGFYTIATDYEAYSANVKYSYLNFRFSANRSEISNKFKFIYGLFGQFDFLLTEAESNHSLHDIVVTDYYDQSDGSISSSSTYEGLVVAEEYDAIDLAPVYFSFGTTIRFRYAIADYFVEIPVSFGASMKPRTISNIANENSAADNPPYHATYLANFLLFYEYGLKIGYTIPNTTPSEKSNSPVEEK
jgi:hypothetical protein